MNVVQTALSSARFNRMLFWLGAAVLGAGVLVLVLKLAGGSDHKTFAPDKGFRPTLPAHQIPLTNAQGVRIDKFEQLDPTVRTTVRTFLATAVARKHLDQSWAVIAPSMKVGYTYSKWKNADELPVVPYPGADVKSAQYYLDYASTTEILLEVGLSQRADVSKKIRARPTAFQLGLRPV